MNSVGTAGESGSVRKPRDQDIDVYGLTHTGNVRKENQDHFLIASLTKQMQVGQTSLPLETQQLVEPERLASLAMVADGVGSGGGGEEASREALQAVAQYVGQSTHAFYTSDVSEPEVFTEVLTDAALRCHTSLLERAEHDPDHKRFGTTLTLWLGLWPQAYLLQVGDSRCYLFRDGKLAQLSRDQTMAQELVDQGVMERTGAFNSKWAHVLSSAIGGHQAAPVVTRVVRDWGTIVLLCSDGLTKHVTDERIAERLSALTSSKQACEALLQDALDGGGSDNVTIIIGRTVKPVE
ncbi:MAG: serine/threonine-protein phosphatase [Gemmatimonadales bacterium]|jgi:protein phosphatase